MEDTIRLSPKLPRVCPGCGALARLYRTPRGLKCANCVKEMDSAGLGFGYARQTPR